MSDKMSTEEAKLVASKHARALLDDARLSKDEVVKHGCERLGTAIARLIEEVERLPQTQDGAHVIPLVDQAWSAPWDELETDGTIYHNEVPVMRTEKKGYSGA